VTAQEAATVLGLKSTSVVYDLLATGRLTGQRIPSPKNPPTLRWDIDPQSLEEERLRRERGEGPPRYDVVVQLPDLKDAMERGELASMAPEDVREFVQAKRAEALAAQDLD
jgi:hypothetical protein